MSQYRKAFRSTAGLDAAGQNVINVADPRLGELLDGINQQYFIEQNTVQEYDPTREHYHVGFLVEFNQRIYKCRTEVTAAEPFDPLKWQPMRTDPEWQDTDQSGSASVGDFLYITASGAITISLPLTPEQGDTVTIADGVGILSEYPVTIQATGGYTILQDQVDGTVASVTDVLMNIPRSTVYLIFNGVQWSYQLHNASVTSIIGSNHPSQQGASYTDSGFLLSLEERSLYFASIKPIAYTLPRNATEGDMVLLYDSAYLTAQTTVFLNVHPDDALNGIRVYDPFDNTPNEQVNLDNVGSMAIVAAYDSTAGEIAWYPVIQNDPGLWAKVGSSATAQLRSRKRYEIQVADGLPSVALTLPEDPFDGDWIEVSNPNTANVPITINVNPNQGVGEPDENDPEKYKIFNTFDTYRQKKYSFYDSLVPTYNDSDTISPLDIGYSFVLVYFADTKLWKYVNIANRVDVADSQYPKRPGIVTLATPDETLAHNIANANPEDTGKPWADQSPLVDDVVTVDGLDKRRAAEDQVGMARIASLTADEALEESRTLAGDVEDTRFPDTDFRHDIIVTPRSFNARTGTETRRGVFEVATQTETRSETNDTHVLTPMKFHAAQAEEELSGTGKIVRTTGTIDPSDETVVDTSSMRSARPNNGAAGTVFDHDDHLRFVTPHTLNQIRATEAQPGMLWVTNASEMRVNNSTVDDAIITPQKLAGWYASAAVRGIARSGTQAEVNAQSASEVADGLDDRPDENWTSVFVTPETLHNRTATEDRRGVAETATQAEVDGGTADSRWFVSPLKFKTWQSYDHFDSDGVGQGGGYGTSGISHAGNIWDGISLSIALANETQRGTLEVATQSETNEHQVWNGSSFDGAVPSDEHVITPAKLDKRRSTDAIPGVGRRATEAEVFAGDDSIGNNDNDPAFVTPGRLTGWQRTATEARALETRYGVVENTTVSETWVGNQVDGSTLPYTGYRREGTSVSPYALNYALENYLPKQAKAADSELLDGIDSTQFLRSDEDDHTSGRLTVGDAEYDTKGTLIVRGSGRDMITMHTNDNTLPRGFAFRNAGGSYTSSIYSINNGANNADIVFATGSYNSDVDSLTERMRLIYDGGLQLSTFLDVDSYIREDQGDTNTDLTYGTYSSPGDGTLREKYLGINNVAKAAEKWVTARTLSISGDAVGSASIDGTGDVDIDIQIGDANHNHSGENITTGTVNNDRLNKSTRNQQGIVRVTNDARTADPVDPDDEHLALSAGVGKALSERIDLFTPDGGTGDRVAYRDYIQVGETRISTSDEGVLEFTFGHPIA